MKYDGNLLAHFHFVLSMDLMLVVQFEPNRIRFRGSSTGLKFALRIISSISPFFSILSKISPP